MSTLTLGIIVIIYMFVIAWLGYLGYRQTKNASDYLLGGRKVNPIIMALSYGATFISASAIVGFGGVAATFGMGIQWLCLLNMFMGVVVAFIFFGRRTRKLGEAHNARTFPQLLGLHYKSRSIQIFIASIIFIGMPLYAAVVMKGGAVFHRTDVSHRPSSGLVDLHLDRSGLRDYGRYQGSTLYGCVASGYHVRLYAIPAILVLPYHGHGLYRGEPEVDGYRPHGARTLQGLGTSRMDSYAHLRLSTMVYIGYLIDPWRRNRLLSAATTSRTLHDGGKYQATQQGRIDRLRVLDCHGRGDLSRGSLV